MIKEALVREAVHQNSIEWRRHALEKMLERMISQENVKEVLLSGETIETYATDRPFPGFLKFKFVRNRPLHVVAALDEQEPKVYVITAYEPLLEMFMSDFKTRRR